MTRIKKSWLAKLVHLCQAFSPLTKPRRRPRFRPQLELLEDRTAPAAFTVTTRLDNGDNTNPTAGSLRAAIIAVNAGTNDTIIFNIGNGAQQIAVGAPLPAITKTVTIDGTPPPNSNQTIELNGANLQNGGDGLTLAHGYFSSSADGSKVYGLTIDHFPGNGIVLDDVANVLLGANNGMQNSSGNAIANGQGVNVIYSNGNDGIDITGASSTNDSVIASFIGTDKNSTAGLGNISAGVAIEGQANGNHIGPGSLGKGGTVGGDGINLISGNQQYGVDITAPNNTVAGNMIGTDASGLNKLANNVGVAVFGGGTTDVSKTTIGGQASVTANIITTPVNVISGNTVDGLQLSSGQGVVVSGNFIGTDKTGAGALANGSAGVELSGTTSYTIGGSQPSLGNVISGNNGDGIVAPLNNTPTQNNVIQDNWIGTANDGTTKLANTGLGVNFSGAGASKNTVIGNVIARNGKGAYSDPNQQNKMDGTNRIVGNLGPGINTGSANGSPVLTSATVSGSMIIIQGTLTSTPDSSFMLEFFGNQDAVTPGYEQGEMPLGPLPVTTDDNGDASFTATRVGVFGHYVSATATGTADDGFTSQFSAYVAISGESTVTLSASSSPSSYGQPVTFTAQADPTATGLVVFLESGIVLDMETLNSSGQASFTTSTLPAGNNPIIAAYTVYTNINSGTSATFNQVVNPDPTSISLASSLNPAATGQSVTFTALVTPSYTAAPVGAVTFYDGGTALDTETVVNGQASFTTSSLALGDHSITAVYSGNNNYAGSTSAVLTQSIITPVNQTVTGFTFSVWLYSGDTLTSVDWLITDSAFGGNTEASGTATGSTLSTTFAGTNIYGYDVYTVTVSLDSSVTLAAGTYWLQLQNAVTAWNSYAFWGESDGPSQANESGYGGIGSEVFSILGQSGALYTNGGPDPGINAWAINNGSVVTNSFTLA